MAMLTVLLTLLVGLVLGVALGLLWARSRPERVQALGQGLAEQAEMMHGLDRLSDQMRALEHGRASWQGQLAQQVEEMRHTTESLRAETRSLSTALRKPQVRGRWGEMHLRRAVELAGLVDRCDFSEQVRLEDGARRPDLVVRMVGGRQVVIDAKVPLDAFLDAAAAADDAERDHHLARHARQLRTHADGLASKAYWRSLPQSPEFVVLFVPAESFLSAALEADPELIDHAAARQVVLATPTTLIALLRTVAQGWTHESLTERAREVHQLGRELHSRLGTFAGHLDAVGRSLNTAVGHYNATTRSLESRVLVTARRLGDLGVSGEELPAPRTVDLHAVELHPTEEPVEHPTDELIAEPADRRAATHHSGGDSTVAL